ncbi:IS3 family transposase [Sulfurovum sp.]|uniref:IS3 family transposase n=1 Tax=Sulfurovum sp. TaxID=1969726 RepID=UPI0039C9E2CE
MPPRYTDEFKEEAARQVIKNNYSVKETAERLGVHPHSLSKWVKQYSQPDTFRKDKNTNDELKRLKAELKRVTEERDIPKKGRSVLCQRPRLKYAFIKVHEEQYPVRRLCKVMQVHPSGYYAWCKNPLSNRDRTNHELVKHIKDAYDESGRTYGYRNIHKDLTESGITVNKKRVARLMRLHKLYGAGTLKKKPHHKSGRPHYAHPNHLKQCFITNKPNEAWVTDITYIRTYEGWLYLAVVLDLFSRKIIGWAMSHRMTSSLALDALHMAIRRQQPKEDVLLHSDQGSQYSSYAWQNMLKHFNIIPSMSRRGNCYDNAVVESFFKTLKRECVKKQVFVTREEAKAVIFHYIEMFYNSKRRHSYLDYLSPNEFEVRYYLELKNLEVLSNT